MVSEARHSSYSKTYKPQPLLSKENKVSHSLAKTFKSNMQRKNQTESQNRMDHSLPRIGKRDPSRMMRMSRMMKRRSRL
jgi:hypothetical protein